mmetsp:Transcript_3543/g.7918  ORF Transcript_3543/g.7918 Transcript_3543/m.7918 type:complete len:214 (-) Transcript_3543:183-824(-)
MGSPLVGACFLNPFQSTMKPSTKDRVKKKFQWTPYSETCSWYSRPLFVASLTNPIMNRGRHFFVALNANDPTACGAPSAPRAFNADVHPAMMTKLLAPMSIRPYPLSSVLQYLRGKIGKSTARIAIVVSMYTDDLCTVRKAGRLGSINTWHDDVSSLAPTIVGREYMAATSAAGPIRYGRIDVWTSSVGSTTATYSRGTSAARRRGDRRRNLW